MTTIDPNIPQPQLYDQIYEKLNIDPEKTYSESELSQIADTIVSLSGEGDASKIAQTLESLQATNIPITEEKFIQIFGDKGAFVPPPKPDNSESAGDSQSRVNNFFKGSVLTAITSVGLEFMGSIRFMTQVVGKKLAEVREAGWDATFRKMDNQKELGQDAATKEYANAAASFGSAVASGAAAGYSIYKIGSVTQKVAEEKQAQGIDQQKKDVLEARLDISRSAGENAQGAPRVPKDNDLYGGLSKKQLDRKDQEIAAQESKIKLEAFQEASAYTQVATQVANTVENIGRGTASVVGGTMEAKMGRTRADNEMQDQITKVSDQSVNQMTDVLYKGNPGDIDRVGSLVNKTSETSSRMGHA